jgi:hypothetical protein
VPLRRTPLDGYLHQIAGAGVSVGKETSDGVLDAVGWRGAPREGLGMLSVRWPRPAVLWGDDRWLDPEAYQCPL